MGSGQRKIEVNASVLSGVLMLVFAGVALWGAKGGSPTIWIFPRVAAGVAGLAGAMLIGIGVWKGDRVTVWETSLAAVEVVVFAAILIVYVAALALLGMWLASALLIGGIAYAFGEGRSRWGLAKWMVVGLAVGLALDALFVGVFDVPLPGGSLWRGADWRWWAP